MSKKAYWPNKKGLTKKIGDETYYLGKACDLTHGRGWFCQIFNDKGVRFGFHKTNKFIAIKIAQSDKS